MADDMQAIRETLARIEAHIDGMATIHGCAVAGCKTLTIARFCAKHAPLAGWAVAS